MKLLGHDFRVWRESWELTREQATAGYVDEMSQFAYVSNPAPTFGDYLVAMTGSGWPMSGRAPQVGRWGS